MANFDMALSEDALDVPGLAASRGRNQNHSSRSKLSRFLAQSQISEGCTCTGKRMQHVENTLQAAQGMKRSVQETKLAHRTCLSVAAACQK